jgi:hypothetical protein
MGTPMRTTASLTPESMTRFFIACKLQVPVLRAHALRIFTSQPRHGRELVLKYRF